MLLNDSEQATALVVENTPKQVAIPMGKWPARSFKRPIMETT